MLAIVYHVAGQLLSKALPSVGLEAHAVHDSDWTAYAERTALALGQTALPHLGAGGPVVWTAGKVVVGSLEDFEATIERKYQQRWDIGDDLVQDIARENGQRADRLLRERRETQHRADEADKAKARAAALERRSALRVRAVAFAESARAIAQAVAAGVVPLRETLVNSANALSVAQLEKQKLELEAQKAAEAAAAVAAAEAEQQPQQPQGPDEGTAGKRGYESSGAEDRKSSRDNDSKASESESEGEDEGEEGDKGPLMRKDSARDIAAALRAMPAAPGDAARSEAARHEEAHGALPGVDARWADAPWDTWHRRMAAQMRRVADMCDAVDAHRACAAASARELAVEGEEEWAELLCKAESVAVLAEQLRDYAVSVRQLVAEDIALLADPDAASTLFE
eukprot:m51a1_g6598 hypothetical protein (397) ;mRNA; r:309413-310930